MFETIKSYWSILSTKAATPLSSSAALDLFAPLSGTSGVAVTAETALRVPAVSQGVALIAQSIGTLDAGVHQDKPGGREAVLDHPAALVIQRPNSWQGETRFKTQIVADTLLHGNGVGLVSRVRGEPRELHRLDPRAVTTDADAMTGEPIYKVTLTDGGVREYGPADVIHLRGHSVDGIRGLGVVTLARDAIALALLLEQHAAQLFASGAKPGGIPSVPGRLDQNVLDRLRSSFSNRYGGPNGSRTMILESGVSFTPQQLTSVDAEFSACREFQVVEIARALNMPVTLLNDLSAATFSNAESLAQAFLDRTIVPIVEQFEDELERVLLTQKERDSGLVIEFDTSGFVRADVEKRFGALKTGIESGVYTLNEARATEGLPPVDGGDQPMRSVQTLPLNETGAAAQQNGTAE